MKHKYKMTREKRYLINMLTSELYQEDPRPELTLNFLRSMEESTHYTESQKNMLNELRERYKEGLQKRWKKGVEWFEWIPELKNLKTQIQ